MEGLLIINKAQVFPSTLCSRSVHDAFMLCSRPVYGPFTFGLWFVRCLFLALFWGFSGGFSLWVGGFSGILRGVIDFMGYSGLLGFTFAWEVDPVSVGHL